MKARETYLRQKMEELEALQRQGIERRHRAGPAQFGRGDRRAPRSAAASAAWTTSCSAGIPPGSQMLVNGPSHTGKDILARLFVAEGLKQAVPAVWVVTDKTYTQIREEMTQLFPAYPEFEQKGMVRYVDLYSPEPRGHPGRARGPAPLGHRQGGPRADEPRPSTTPPTSSRRSSAATASSSSRSRPSPPTSTPPPCSGSCSRSPAVGSSTAPSAYYLLETGMHTESDLQTIEHMMDGSINLKIDQLKTFLSVKGISEVQSRAWIGYTFSKKAFSLGSFSLDHIR